MTDTGEVFLGITAFSVLVMALIQVGGSRKKETFLPCRNERD